MIILQAVVRPEYPWLKKLCIYLLNWLLWGFPAMADVTADDVGDEYQTGVTILVAFTIATICTLLLFGSAWFALPWWGWGIMTLGVYLLFGALYYWHERHWNP